MGTSTTLDLRPLIADKEDADDALEVSWLSAHVALADDGDHVLLVVAPVDWFGVEPIIVTVTDTGGKAASATLNVTVDQVIVAPPPPDCDTTFSLAAPGATSVLVTGTFASWAQTAPPATTLTDPDGDSTFTGKVTLAAGTYQYKFIVNGVWKADPANPSTTPDGFGGVNSVLEVPTCP